MPANLNNSQSESIDQLSKDLSKIYSLQTIRILRDQGFFGITLPAMMFVPGASAQTAANFTTPFFIANRTYQVVQVIERHETAGTDAGSVTLMLKKVASGTAPSSGTDVLSAGISLKATANTNQTITSTSSTYIKRGSSSILTSGNALSLVTTGTLTALVGVTVHVLLRAI